MTIYWQPGRLEMEKSQVAEFMARLGREHAESWNSFEKFHAWTLLERDKFWRGWLEASGIVFRGSAEKVYIPDPGKNLGPDWGGRWFPDVQLNFAENLMAHLPSEAIVGLGEHRARTSLSRESLRAQVANLQAFLRAHGVGEGDRVAAVVPNCPEAVVAMLAVTSLGAVWASCSPDFGVQGIVDRFAQIDAKVLILCDGYTYQAKRFELAEKNLQVRAALTSSVVTLEIAFLSAAHPAAAGTLDFAKACAGPERTPQFAPLPFDHPAFIMFSSGTTGAPKCIVHRAGGVLLQLVKEHKLHCDLRPGEKLLYYTTCGWMMWNWAVTGLASGVTLYCYDGSPLPLHAPSIWDVVDAEGVQVFGTSAKFLASCRSGGIEPAGAFGELRLVLSTGSPLMAEDFDYFYTTLRPTRPVQLSSISGGTDILSCFLLGTPLKPVVRGEIQGKGLGLDVAAYSDTGTELVGQKGELVCRHAFPSMPLGFWHDAENRKYRAAYFAKFPGVWHHGDFITLTAAGGIIIHGRSDATLNPGGVRIGTAEIYRQVETHPLVADSLVVGQAWRGDERVILFIKLKDPGAEITEELRAELKEKIRVGASARHVPARIEKVLDIPYTLSGKKVELAVKMLLHGEEPKNVEALINPASLDFFRELKLN